MDNKRVNRDYYLNLERENRELRERLYFDNLTRLPNSLSFDEEIKSAKNPKVMVIDIDSFVEINNYYGKKIADYVLKEVAKEIDKYARNEGMKTFRIGYDQFVLLDDSFFDLERYERVVKELISFLKINEILVPDLDESVVIEATIGLCLEEEDVLNKALKALAKAKREKKDFVCYFQGMSLKEGYEEKIQFTKMIKKALQNDKVFPYYQPILNRNGEIVKYESLMRIKAEDDSLLTPNLFMSVSKKVKLYKLLTKSMIEKCFKEASISKKTISINLLPDDLSDNDINNFLIDMLKEYKVAKNIVFEILEDESLENLNRAYNFIDRVKSMGVRIAIDDFGTGYSNFVYLMNLKPDYLKIDGSIVKNIVEDKSSQEILKAIVAFAKSLGIKTIAEYVASKEIYEKCYEMGIDEFQGYFLGEPKSSLVNPNI